MIRIRGDQISIDLEWNNCVRADANIYITLQEGWKWACHAFVGSVSYKKTLQSKKAGTFPLFDFLRWLRTFLPSLEANGLKRLLGEPLNKFAQERAAAFGEGE